MRVEAPGKLLLSGAYAVLEGAPAIVAAVARYAYADADVIDPSPSAEIAEAFKGGSPPRVTTEELYHRGSKLGIGSSAAAVVAAVAASAAKAGDDLRESDARARIFDRARRAHAAVQSGGSGVDVAASVYGGLLRYSLGEPPQIEAVSLPPSLAFTVFFSGSSARTSELRSAVERFAGRDPRAYRAAFDRLRAAAADASAAFQSADAAAFIEASRVALRGLSALGVGADVPIVPPSFMKFALSVESSGGAFIPSGAGGGDVGVLFSVGPPDPHLVAEGESLGLSALDIQLDASGVRVSSTRGASSSASEVR